MVIGIVLKIWIVTGAFLIVVSYVGRRLQPNEAVRTRARPAGRNPPLLRLLVRGLVLREVAVETAPFAIPTAISQFVLLARLWHPIGPVSSANGLAYTITCGNVSLHPPLFVASTTALALLAPFRVELIGITAAATAATPATFDGLQDLLQHLALWRAAFTNRSRWRDPPRWARFLEVRRLEISSRPQGLCRWVGAK